MAFEPPVDRFRLIYITFLLNGIAFLLPWNMFINAVDYYTNHKFSKEYMKKPLPVADSFMQYVTFSAQVPSVIFQWLNVFVEIKGGLIIRVMISAFCMAILFVITTALAIIDTSEWSGAFFVITMLIVFILNAFNGIYQNCIYGMAARLPPFYMGAIVLGNDVCGTFISIVDIISKASTKNLRGAAIYYFIIAVLVLLLGMDLIFAMPINRFYNYHDQVQQKRERETKEEQIKAETSQKIPYWQLIKQSWLRLINVFLTLFICICVFPAIQAGIEPVNKDHFLGKYYTSVTCFLTFNFFAMFGSFLGTLHQWPTPDYLWIAMTCRLALIPAFLLCNYQPPNVKRRIPVLLKSDFVNWFLSIINGFTTGYFTTVSMIYAPGNVEPKYAPFVGMLASAILMTGIFCAILVTFIWPYIV